MKVTQPTTPCYCTECDDPNAMKVRFQNPRVGEQATLALCDKHAEALASRLLSIVARRRQLKAIGSRSTRGDDCQ